MSTTHERTTDLPVRHDHHVAGQHICSRSPLMLPQHVCVRCGSRKPGGVVKTETISWVHPAVWFTALISLFITWIAYRMTRKRIIVRYYLCPDCADRKKIRTVTAGTVAWVSAIGFFAGPVVGMSMFGTFFFTFLCSTVAWAVFRSAPLTAVAHDDGLFTLKGASPELLEATRLPHEDPPSPRALPPVRSTSQQWTP